MKREEAFAHTAGCYNGEPASCSFACPFRLDLRSFLKKASRGRWSAAYKELQSAVLFPSVVSALCPHPCEDVCQRQTVLGGDPVSIWRIERASLAYTERKEAVVYAIPPKSERIAVVGAGPAGLSSALRLAQKRYQVTVFDQNEIRGGALLNHPLTGDFDEDYTLAFSTVQVEFRLGVRIYALTDLNAYDAILLATGSRGAHFGLLDSWEDGTCATGDPRVFLAGTLTGVPLMDGMAQAVSAVRSVESYLQSGNVYSVQDTWDSSKRSRFAPHGPEEAIPGVIPAGGSYTAEEAREEAARCMLCDCTACLDACELLIRYQKKPPRIGNDVFMDGQSRNSVSSAGITRQTWSCSLCGRCGTKCAEGVDLRGLFQLSRADRVESGYYPPALHDYWLQDMAFASGPAGFASVGPGHTQCNYAFFPGCRLGASDPSYVTHCADFLLDRLGAGVILDCCGAPAYWAGDQHGFHDQLSALSARWDIMGNPILVTACTTCERMLTQFLPHIPFVSLYEILAEQKAPAAGSQPAFSRAAVYDPCAAIGKNAVKTAVRRLAAAGGIEVTDFDNGGKCCGFGGHMQLANPSLYDAITGNRADETDDPYIVYCANCRDVFLSHGKPCIHILDVIFDTQPRVMPTLEEKRENRLTAKEALVALYRSESIPRAADPWDNLSVAVPQDIQDKMERLLIPLSRVREAIWSAEQAGDGFVHGNGDILCSREKGALTYWALYGKIHDAGEERFTLKDAYCHRMRQKGGP